MSKQGESWMPKGAGLSTLGRTFRVPLAALPAVARYLYDALEDAAFLDLEIQEHAGVAAAGLVVFQQPEMELYQRLVEAARNRLADMELEYGIEKSKVDASSLRKRPCRQGIRMRSVLHGTNGNHAGDPEVTG